MNPLVVLKGAAAHATLEEFKAWLTRRETWQLWAMLAVLGLADVVTALVDFIPLIDDAMLGVPAFFIGLELNRRRKEAKEKKAGT